MHKFKPQPNITPYELAIAMGLEITWSDDAVARLPEHVRRHFVPDMPKSSPSLAEGWRFSDWIEDAIAAQPNEH